MTPGIREHQDITCKRTIYREKIIREIHVEAAKQTKGIHTGMLTPIVRFTTLKFEIVNCLVIWWVSICVKESGWNYNLIHRRL